MSKTSEIKTAKTETNTKKETTTMTTEIALDITATDLPKVKPSFIPELIVNKVIENRDAKIWASKTIKKGEEKLLYFHAIGNDKKIVGELMARLWEEGFVPANNGKMERIDITKWCAIYLVPEEKNDAFRASFRLCKSPGKYNNPGLIYLATMAAEEKAKKAAVRAEERRIERLKRSAEKALKKVKEAEKALAAAEKAMADAEKNAA